MSNLLSDLRYAIRQFRLSPVFAGTAILTMALGIGGTTAIFSLIHTVMLRSLPVADPAMLYRIGDGNECCVEGGPQDRWGMFSYPFYQRLLTVTPEFESLAAFQTGAGQFSVRQAGAGHLPKSVRGEYVTGNYFSTFGVPSFAGRLLSAADDQASAAPVVVMSARLWQTTYASDPSIIGTSLVIQDHPFTVIGIAPPGFYGETLRSDPPDLWVPLAQEPLIAGDSSLLRQPISAWLRVIGRLRPGASTAGMGPRLTSVLRRWMLTDSGYPSVWISEVKRVLPKQVIDIVPAGAGVGEMKEDYGRSLQILLAVCGLVLLIACANTANLLLARGMARRSETSVRLAIGASRRRLISQALTESVLLSLAGGVAGLLVAVAAGKMLLRLAFHSAHFLPISAVPSLPVLAFSFALSLLTGIIFGAAPAWFAARTDPVVALRGANRSTRDSSSLSRNLLLVLQATLSVVLIAGAMMLARSLGNLSGQNFGFQTQNRITVNLNSPPATYSQERLAALYRDLEDRLKRLPGVQHVSLSLYNPFTDNWGELVVVEGRSPHLSENDSASWDRVSADYFNAVGQSMQRGRSFTQADNDNDGKVAIVNEAFVRKFLPKVNPIDKHFGIDLPENARTFRIVGVVQDAKYIEPDKPARPMFFVPLAQHIPYPNNIIERIEVQSHFIGNALLVTNAEPGALEPVLRKVFSDADANLTINSVRTLQQQVDLNFDQQRAVASLAGLFGLVALVLAAVGLYGVTAYSVAQRTSEIGVRMALGANRNTVLRLILSGAFRKVALGLLIGVPLAIGCGKLISAQLYGLSSWDPVALLGATAALAICGFIAAIIPALRAAALHPMRALRTE